MKRSTDTALFLCLGFFLGGGARLGAQETIDFLVPDTWSGYTFGMVNLQSYNQATGLWTVQIQAIDLSAMKAILNGPNGPYGLPDPGAAVLASEGMSVGTQTTTYSVPPGMHYPFSVQNCGGHPSAVFYIPPAPDPSNTAEHKRFIDRADPVELATGSEVRHKRLFSFKGTRNWDFDLTYNSQFAQEQWTPTPMAPGWSHGFQATIGAAGSNLMVNWDQTCSNTFTPTVGNPNVYTSTEDRTQYDTIVAQSGGGWLLTHRDQSSLLFNANGQLIVDSDPHGHVLNLAYSGVNLASVSDPISNTSVSLSYNIDGLLQTLTDSAGATVQFTYQQQNGQWVLAQITDQDGHNMNYSYDNYFRLLTITDNAGNPVISNTYDGFGRVASQVDGKGQTSTFSYSIANGVTTTTYTDRNGNSEICTFDSNYNKLTDTNALNQTTTYAYDSANRVTSITDALNRKTAYTYDSQGNVLTVTDPAGNVRTYTYDSRNNQLTATDPLGHVTTRTYDSNNDLLTNTDALGNTTTLSYNANSQPLAITLPRGGVYALAYTAGELAQVTDPNSIVATYGYDADGRILYKQDALGNRTTCTYDGVGHHLTVTNPLSQVFAITYDYRNRVTGFTEPTGAATTYTYDNNNNLLTRTDALANVTAYSYDPEDRLETVTDPLSRITTLAYDSVGKLLSITDPAGNVTAGQYDGAGQLVATTDALGKNTTFTHELRGLLSGVTDPLNRLTTITYDINGREIANVDPLSRQTHLAYDALDRLTQVTDPGSLVTTLAFDNDGNPNSLTNPAGNATTFTFDAGDRLTASATPAGRTTSVSYDARGLPLTVTRPSSNATTFAYDATERLSSFADTFGTVSLTRDASGRVLTINEGGMTLTRVYDASGHLTSYTDGAGNVVGYQYDALGRLTQLAYPGGRQVTYAYNAAGRLSTVTDWASRVTSYSYDADGRPTQLLRPNGTKQVRTYDAAGQLTQLIDYSPSGSTAIYSATYGFDLAGQLTSAILSPATSGATANVTQTVDQDDRLLTQNGSSVTIDPDGNLLSIASGVIPATYAYDARNRLTAAGGLTYGYNSENRRVSVTDSTGTTQFAINPNAVLDQVLVKTAPNGTQTYYVYGLGLLYEDTGGAARFYHFDRRGDTIALTDITGSVSGTIAYGAYGEILSQTGQISTPFLFNGLWGIQTDSNGLYFHRARYYHPALRRWLSGDPIGEAGGLNLYGYVANDPIIFIDPTGLLLNTTAAGMAAYQAAKQYAGGIPAAAALFSAIENSPTTFNLVIVDSHLTPDFDPNTNTITWNPKLGFEFAGGIRLSPARILLHELDHAQESDCHPYRQWWHQWSFNPENWFNDYGNAEEERVITGSETLIGEALGEGVRSNHSPPTVTYSTLGPGSTAQVTIY